MAWLPFTWPRLLKALVSLCLLAYVVWLVDWHQVAALWRDGRLYQLWPGPLLLTLGLWVAAARWRLMLAAQGVEISHRQALTLYWRATFFGVFLPGVIGGDVVRAVLCQRATGANPAVIAFGIAAERLAGMWCLAAIGTIGVLLLPDALKSAFSVSLIGLTPAMALLIPLLVWAALCGRHVLAKLTRPLWVATLSAAVVRMMDSLARVPAGVFSKVLVAGLVFQFSEILVFALFGHILGLTVPWHVWMFVVPLVYLATVLPVSVGGLGVREGALVWLLAQAGVVSASAALLALLIYLNRVVTASVGAVLDGTDERLTLKPPPLFDQLDK